MSWTPLETVREEATEPVVDISPSTALTPRDTTIGPPSGTLRPRDYLILGKVFEGKKPKTIATEMGLSLATVAKILARADFQAEVRRVEEGMLERITAGEFGVLAIAKSEAIPAIRRIVGIAQGSEDDKIKFAANKWIVEMAGIQPPTPKVVENPERILDRMTAEELERFAATREIPDRLVDDFARIASASMDRADPVNQPARVEVPLDSSRRRPPREVVPEAEYESTLDPE